MEELIDVLDEAGVPTGARKAKRLVHADGDWHRVVQLWIVDLRGWVLLQRRSPGKENWPGFWDISAAGHVAAGETALDAIVREAREELGLDLGHGELTHLASHRQQWVLNDGTYHDNEIAELFVAVRDVELPELRLDAVEVMDALFVSPDVLESFTMVPHPAAIAALRQFLGGR
jgi:isopentenyldiphosphate isomerase